MDAPGATAPTSSHPVGRPLARDTPASRGVDPAGIIAFLDAAEAAGLELHGLMVFRGGAVVAEGWWSPYAAHRPHMLHSAVKSWTGTAVGIAAGDGLLRLDDPVLDFFPEHRPAAISSNLAAMTVRDLLTMRSSHRTGVSGGEWRKLSGSWVAAFLNEPVPDRPGEAFIYNSGSSYMLSAIVTKVTGRTAHDLLDERLFRPMGCGEMAWDLSPEDYSTGGNGLSCTLEDMLKFGVLHLQDGMWDGRRLLPEGWVAEATRNHVQDVWMAAMDGQRYLPREGAAEEKREGYGYQWWMTRDGGYRASGMFGQQCIVLPHHDAVIAVNAALGKSEKRLTPLIHAHLVPALGRAGAPASAAELSEGMAVLRLPLPQGAATPAASGQTPGIAGRWIMAPNEDGVREIALTFKDGRCRFTMRDGRGEHAVTAGLGQELESETSITGAKLHHAYEPGRMRVAAAAAWPDPATLVMNWRFVETAFCDTVTLRFDGDGITFDRRVNTNAAALERPTLTGRRA